ERRLGRVLEQQQTAVDLYGNAVATNQERSIEVTDERGAEAKRIVAVALADEPDQARPRERCFEAGIGPQRELHAAAVVRGARAHDGELDRVRRQPGGAECSGLTDQSPPARPQSWPRLEDQEARAFSGAERGRVG